MKHHCNTWVKKCAKILLCIVVFSREERHEYNVIHSILERRNFTAIKGLILDEIGKIQAVCCLTALTDEFSTKYFNCQSMSNNIVCVLVISLFQDGVIHCYSQGQGGGKSRR